MKKNTLKISTKAMLFGIIVLFNCSAFGQQIQIQPRTANNSTSPFWKNVHFGGGIGLGFSNGYTNISLSPSAIYNVNEQVSLGLGVHGAYISSKDNYSQTLLGGSLISYFNPIKSIQLSAELEETNINNKYTGVTPNITSNFWNTAFFLGAGYRMGNSTIGVRYNVLYDANKSLYPSAWVPFVRVYF